MRKIAPTTFLLVIAVMMLCALRSLADGTNEPPVDPSTADELGSPLVLFTMLVLGVAFLFVLGVGIAVGLVLCAVIGGLVMFNILSFSVAIGFLRRNPASGLRALFLQLGAALGIPCGIGAAWLVSHLVHNHWSTGERLLVGGSSGLVCGVVAAALLNLVWGRIALRTFPQPKSG